MKFLTNIDLNKNELQNAVIQNLSTSPSGAVKGQIYYNSVDKHLYQYDGSEWKKVGAATVSDVTSDAGKVITSASTSGDVTTLGTTNVVNLELDGYSKGSDGSALADGDKVGTAFGKLEKRIDTIISQGGEPNVITNIKIGNTVGTVDATNKLGVVPNATTTTDGGMSAADKTKLNAIAVNTTAKSVTDGTNTLSNIVSDASYVHTDNNYTTAEKQKLAGLDGSTYATKTELTSGLANKLDLAGGTMSGNIAMGTNKITGLGAGTNNTDAVNKGQLDSAIAGLGTVFRIKGSKPTVADLPSTGNTEGDVWFVVEKSAGYIWINKGTQASPQLGWEEFGEPIDLSGYLQITNLASSTGSSTVTAMTQAATTNELNLRLKHATGTIAVNATTGTVSVPSGSVIVSVGTYQNGVKVITDVSYSGTTVTATTASAVTGNAVNIIVAYK